MSNLAKKYNLKSPAVKRLMREAAELSEPTEQYFAQPVEDNLFEWHFTVRGPPDTPFSDGRYHGRITLPPEYPMKPPSIILLTPNGRFELGKKICLSMSAHHPETWQPSWSIRTVLLALIGFMPTKGGGAIGALDYTPEERKLLAERSNNWTCETCTINNKECLLEPDPDHENLEMNEARELAAQINFKGENEKNKTQESPTSQDDHQPQPVNQQPNPQVHGVDNMDQQAYNYFSQFYNIHNQPGGMQPQPGQFMPAQQDQPRNIPQSDSASLNPIAQNNVENNIHSPTESNVRQRANIDQEQARQRNISNASLTNAPIQRTSGHSAFDGVTLGLMWVIAIILVILILRRLAMEGASLTKTQ